VVPDLSPGLTIVQEVGVVGDGKVDDGTQPLDLNSSSVVSHSSLLFRVEQAQIPCGNEESTGREAASYGTRWCSWWYPLEALKQQPVFRRGASIRLQEQTSVANRHLCYGGANGFKSPAVVITNVMATTNL
jgi:hypothetical protein